MANYPTAQISFTFAYDGSTNSVSIDTQKGPVFYQGNGALHPLFSTAAINAINVVIASQIGNITGTVLTPTTATISSTTLKVNIPSGLKAGTFNVFATLQY